MGKILFFLILGLAVYLLLKKQIGPGRSSPTRVRPENQSAEDMVKCAHCGVNLPRSEAIYSQGEFFCTPEHRQLQQK